jgi:hypothetical protein
VEEPNISNDTPDPIEPARDSPSEVPLPPRAPEEADGEDPVHPIGESGSDAPDTVAPQGPLGAGAASDSGRSTRIPPQRIPPLPRSRFTRHLIDYVGGGQYQLSAQGAGEGIVPIAKADSPIPLLMIAGQTSEPGDELIIAPAVALIDVVCMETAAIRILQSKGQDPFERIGNAFAKRSEGEASEESPTVLRPRRDQRDDAQRSDEGRSDEGVHETVNGVDPADLPEVVRELLARDRKSGGRLGWIFRVERVEGNESGESDGNPS